MSQQKLSIFLLFCVILVQGCAVAVPVHQDYSGQTLGDHGFDLALLAGNEPSIGPKTFPTGSTFAPTSGNAQDAFEGLRFTFGFAETWDIETELFLSTFTGATWNIALKHQWFGPSFFAGKGGDSFAGMRLRYISSAGYEDNASDWNSGTHIFNGSIFVDKMGADTISFTNSIGYLIADWFSVYAGLEAGSIKLNATLRDGSPTGAAYNGNRTESFYGPLAGLSLHSTGAGFRLGLTYEFESMNFPQTYAAGNRWVSDQSAGLHFLWKTR